MITGLSSFTSEKLTPVIVTSVPPYIEPSVGEIPVTLAPAVIVSSSRMVSLYSACFEKMLIAYYPEVAPLYLRVTVFWSASTDLMYSFLVSTSLKVHSKSLVSSSQTQFPSV
jgi:hypothetical protein